MMLINIMCQASVNVTVTMNNELAILQTSVDVMLFDGSMT